MRKKTVLQDIYRQYVDPAEPMPDEKTLGKRFEKDKERIRDGLGVEIKYDPAATGYVIAGAERPLLNLTDTDLETLAFIADTFQPDGPHALTVRQLIDKLVSWLPPQRQKLFRFATGQQPTADLRLRDSEEITPDVWEAVVEAWQAKQEITFDYLSSRHEDGIKREHHIQPWDLDFTDRGHWRIRGYCLFNDGPNGPWHPNDYLNYRVSRIVSGSVRILSQKLPPVRPLGRPRQVIFELAPSIARFGVSHRRELIAPPQIMEMDEGWVRVEGKTHDVFDLARNLLYYGANCRVLGGKELLHEMRQLTRELRDMYE